MAYRKAIVLRPRFPARFSIISPNALKETGRIDEALACYQRAMELKTGRGRITTPQFSPTRSRDAGAFG